MQVLPTPCAGAMFALHRTRATHTQPYPAFYSKDRGVWVGLVWLEPYGKGKGWKGRDVEFFHVPATHISDDIKWPENATKTLRRSRDSQHSRWLEMPEHSQGNTGEHARRIKRQFARRHATPTVYVFFLCLPAVMMMVHMVRGLCAARPGWIRPYAWRANGCWSVGPTPAWVGAARTPTM